MTEHRRRELLREQVEQIALRIPPEQRKRNLLLEQLEQIDDVSLRPTIPPFIEAPEQRRRDMDELIWAELERLGYGEVVAIRKKYG